MATYIPINTNLRLGAQLRSSIDQLRAAIDGLTKIRAIMGTQTDGVDYTVLEAQFGLNAGDGKKCNYQVSAFLDALGTNNPVSAVYDKTTQLLTQLG